MLSSNRRMEMSERKPNPLSLRLKEVLDREFVREVLDRKEVGVSSACARLLRSNTSTTLVRDKVLAYGMQRKWKDPRLSDLVSVTPAEMRRVAKLGPKTLRWLEEYLSLLGVVLPKTKSVHGMSKTAREFLASL